MTKKLLIVISAAIIIGVMVWADIRVFTNHRRPALKVVDDPRAQFTLAHIQWPDGLPH